MSAKAVAIPLVVDCWNRIGVLGDRTCPELPKHTHCRNCPTFSAAAQHLYDRPPPPGYTDEWTERIAAADRPKIDETIPVILFRIGGEWLALDVALAVEVSPLRTVRRVPYQTDGILAGLVNIRGELQPAVLLRVLLGIHQPPEKLTDAAQRRLLVVESHAARWVFLVDEVDDVFHFARRDLGALPGTVAAGTSVFTRGVFRQGDRSIGYLEPERVFGALKRHFR